MIRALKRLFKVLPTGKVSVFEAANGQWHYRLAGINGEKMHASEGYTREADAWRGARDAQAAWAGAEFVK